MIRKDNNKREKNHFRWGKRTINIKKKEKEGREGGKEDRIKHGRQLTPDPCLIKASGIQVNLVEERALGSRNLSPQGFLISV